MEELLKEVQEIYPTAYIKGRSILFEIKFSRNIGIYVSNQGWYVVYTQRHSCYAGIEQFCKSKDKQKVLNVLKSIKDCRV